MKFLTFLTVLATATTTLATAIPKQSPNPMARRQLNDELMLEEELKGGCLPAGKIGCALDNLDYTGVWGDTPYFHPCCEGLECKSDSYSFMGLWGNNPDTVWKGKCIKW